ncbi:MAG: class I SAM-dependent methyltransferase [Desulfomonilaceae bacterium]
MTFKMSMLQCKNYRKKIYSRYDVLWEDQKRYFDEAEALRWGQSYRYLLRKFLPPNRDAVILDLGCGTGKLLYNMQFMGYQNLQGIDASPEQARIADEVLENVGHGDAFDYLSNKMDQFDVITAFDFFEHFTKDEFLQILDLCYQALRPGGQLILQTVNAHSPMGLSCRYADFTHELCMTPGCLRNLMTLAGFTGFVARERGPMPYNAINTLRYLLWRILRLAFRIYDLVEVAGTRYPIYTRDFIACGIKPVANGCSER